MSVVVNLSGHLKNFAGGETEVALDKEGNGTPASCRREGAVFGLWFSVFGLGISIDLPKTNDPSTQDQRPKTRKGCS